VIIYYSAAAVASQQLLAENFIDTAPKIGKLEHLQFTKWHEKRNQ